MQKRILGLNEEKKMLVMIMKILRIRSKKFMVKKCGGRMFVKTGFHNMELGSCDAVCRQKVWRNRFPYLEPSSHARRSGFLLGVLLSVTMDLGFVYGRLCAAKCGQMSEV